MSLALHVTIAEAIREQIRDGGLTVGTALPSESQLCDTWNASRGPVRQALATLRAEGVIAGGQGKPPIVSNSALAQPFDTLMSYSAWAKSIGRTPGQRTLELALRRADQLSGARVEVESGTPIVEGLRLRYLDGAPAMLERATYIERVGRLLFEFNSDSGSQWAYLQSRGIEFARATHSIDAIAADATDAQQLQIPLGSPLLRQQRITRDSDGGILEYNDDRYLPSLISFTLENTPDVRTTVARNATP